MIIVDFSVDDQMDIIGDAGILYWASVRNVERNDEGIVLSVEVRDTESDDEDDWVLVTREDILEAYLGMVTGQLDIGVHPNWFSWIKEYGDYDAHVGDWLVQYVAFGEQIYG